MTKSKKKTIRINARGSDGEENDGSEKISSYAPTKSKIKKRPKKAAKISPETATYSTKGTPVSIERVSAQKVWHNTSLNHVEAKKKAKTAQKEALKDVIMPTDLTKEFAFKSVPTKSIAPKMTTAKGTASPEKLMSQGSPTKQMQISSAGSGFVS